MREAEIGVRLLNTRRLRMWTQGRLAKEAGLSPTTVSGIETGRIARPHFGTLHKLAAALDVEPQVLLSSSEEPRASEKPSVPQETSGREGSPPLSLQWARSAREERFEQLVEAASLEELQSLVQDLEEERKRLQRLYGEFPAGSEQRRFIKGRIRGVSAQTGSVATSIMFHSDKDTKAHTDGPAGT